MNATSTAFANNGGDIDPAALAFVGILSFLFFTWLVLALGCCGCLQSFRLRSVCFRKLQAADRPDADALSRSSPIFLIIARVSFCNAAVCSIVELFDTWSEFSAPNVGRSECYVYSTRWFSSMAALLAETGLSPSKVTSSCWQWQQFAYQYMYCFATEPQFGRTSSGSYKLCAVMDSILYPTSPDFALPHAPNLWPIFLCAILGIALSFTVAVQAWLMHQQIRRKLTQIHREEGARTPCCHPAHYISPCGLRAPEDYEDGQTCMQDPDWCEPYTGQWCKPSNVACTRHMHFANATMVRWLLHILLLTTWLSLACSTLYTHQNAYLRAGIRLGGAFRCTAYLTASCSVFCVMAELALRHLEAASAVMKSRTSTGGIAYNGLDDILWGAHPSTVLMPRIGEHRRIAPASVLGVGRSWRGGNITVVLGLSLSSWGHSMSRIPVATVAQGEAGGRRPTPATVEMDTLHNVSQERRVARRLQPDLTPAERAAQNSARMANRDAQIAATRDEMIDNPMARAREALFAPPGIAGPTAQMVDRVVQPQATDAGLEGRTDPHDRVVEDPFYPSKPMY